MAGEQEEETVYPKKFSHKKKGSLRKQQQEQEQEQHRQKILGHRLG